ncbi:putative lipase esterase family protein [Rosellinia necatrix]|uniref:Putative lipase esterase family protein n=1 Tax=Rosellinia necatrix TaxID=77044 RepID=A0A1W2TFF9_ROSNE|nr:putative lipase esterase family protein [Rosellinia necatrix]
MNTATVSMAITPTVLSTFVSHYLNRKPLRERPTAHLSYDEGLHLIKSFLAFASQHTVEELQAFTSQWVPHPQWVKVKEAEIPEETLLESASILQEQLGPEGIKKVGGRSWWQWRRPDSPLKAEWVEMRSDYNERIKSGDPCKRVILYIHGGGYYFGSVDEHRYQIQRHARKLKARVFAPKYRLAPQFPFPCGLQDCLAAYLDLLKSQDPSTIILAGDSAGGGMVLSTLVTLRDRGLPLPAGAILISPWVDLTHSFPSLAGDCPLDYIPSNGFHHKPSQAWPPLNADEYAVLKEQISTNTKTRKNHSEKSDQPAESKGIGLGSPLESRAETAYLGIDIDGKRVVLKDQIQMYTTNELLSHPLVSPIMQPSLGGLPPLLIITGGGEILRDEQIYLAHKCANPQKYPPGDVHMNETAREQISRFKPTDVQLQIWDDLCHVAPTLSFTRPAKYMYRSIAQFGAWTLARAQKIDIEIMDDDEISVISSSGTDSDGPTEPGRQEAGGSATESPYVGKAGDPLPPFKNHMIRQRVDRHGAIRPLEQASELPACTLDPNDIGTIKEGPVRKWLETRRQWDNRFGTVRAKVHKKRLKEMMVGYQGFDGEIPPPSSLAARRRVAGELAVKTRRKSVGLALWSLWGSKHDEATVQREEAAEKTPEVKLATKQEGYGARSPSDLERQGQNVANQRPLTSRSHSKTKIVRDENQTEEDVNTNTLIATLMAKREGRVHQDADQQAPSLNSDSLTPYYVPPSTGVAGRRPIVGGIAVPFSLGKEADTASMITLTSTMDQPSRVASPTSLGPERDDISTYRSVVAAEPDSDTTAEVSRPSSPGVEAVGPETPRAVSPLATPLVGDSGNIKQDGEDAIVFSDGSITGNAQRPPLETFVTAQENLPRIQ